MNTNKGELKHLLESKGVKATVQRLEILEYIADNKKHPTADQVYREMVKRMPMLSKTTVYNTLNKLTETGLLIPLAITGTEIRFDSTLESHHHFLCDKCGVIMDIDIKCPVCGRGTVNGNKVREIHGYFKGTCRKCLK
jgi:Fe2+ or Zn2+ uptake regulation protein